MHDWFKSYRYGNEDGRWIANGWTFSSISIWNGLPFFFYYYHTSLLNMFTSHIHVFHTFFHCLKLYLTLFKAFILLITFELITVITTFLSYIRKGKYRPATTTPSRSGYLPWILKWVGLESSGRRLISSIGTTKIIAFFLAKKKKI